jgi:hypothetical protein
MTRQRAFLLGGVLLIALVLAFALQDLVRLALVIPLAYVWWVFELLFGAIPQVVIWGIFVFLIAILLFNSLTTRTARRRSVQEKNKPRLGNVEMLAQSIERSRKGIYIKWQVANRLGRLARDFLIQRGDRTDAKVIGPLTGRDWHPSEPVGTYLEAGLNGSFADYPSTRRFFSHPQPTPLDLNVNEAVDFLEGQMKSIDGRR